MPKLFATCARGLEDVLADELRALGSPEVIPGRGGVQFEGDLALLYKANLWLRSAIRVLWPILDAAVMSPEELYDAVQTIDWSRYLTPEHTLAVDCNVRDSRITHSKYAALKVKDAICDQFIAKCGKRPSVNVDEPMVGLNLHIYRDEAVLSLESSGESLHKRGYRPILTRAPLNEALAAALVLLTGWRGEVPFADPLCGSGHPVHRGGVARFTASARTDATPLRVHGLDELRHRVVDDIARRGAPPGAGKTPRAYRGLRRAPRRHPIRRGNARAAGIGNLVSFDLKKLQDFQPPEGAPGVLLCNPPYGERLGEEKDLRGLYQEMGKVFQQACPGWRVFVFTGNATLARQIDMRPVREVHLFNGKIPCRLLEYRP